MSNRRFEMYDYRQIIHRIRMGQTDREIARTKMIGRTKCAKVRTIAGHQGWLDLEAPLPDDTILAQTLRRSRKITQRINPSVNLSKSRSASGSGAAFVLPPFTRRLWTSSIFPAVIPLCGAWQTNWDRTRRRLSASWISNPPKPLKWILARGPTSRTTLRGA